MWRVYKVLIDDILNDKKVKILVAALVISILFIVFRGITLGIDLRGGSQIIIETERPLTIEEITTVIGIMERRLNSAGLKDVEIKSLQDTFISIKIAGVNPEQAESLIGKPGKLVVKIGNITVFTGSELRRVEPFRYLPQSGAWVVPFTITDEASERFRDGAVETDFEEVYMYMDDDLVNKAPISDDLQAELEAGIAVESMILQTGGDESARKKAQEIEIVLRSGALPVKVNVVASNGISATLGEQFAKNALLAGIMAIIAVASFVFLRYRKPRTVLPIIATGTSEIVMILGFAALVRWNLDLPSIAGIIAAVGTGVDDQIVITDEVYMDVEKSLRSKVKGAWFIIISSYLTTFAAMAPLYIIGLEKMKGFALTVIVGITVGVFISRPAYSQMIQHIVKSEKQPEEKVLQRRKSSRRRRRK
ncbi:MAG: MMPL family transporter [Candidatus Hydrothermarchaeales archaeon]